uniref:Four helix bundle protein n=1 Tax=candidate division WWE3 bacterium TaxID=2053526 RepID=A0A831Z101_UNCKA
MSKEDSFENLKIWQEGHRLMLAVYKATSSFPKSEIYGLVSQVRSAALSVPSNIAESEGRYHYADSIKFILNARGSAFEVRSQLRAARDLNYLDSKVFETLDEDYAILIKSINSYINYLERRKEDGKA